MEEPEPTIEAFEAAWDALRGFSPADLQAFTAHLEPSLEMARERAQYEEEEPYARRARQQVRLMERQLAVCHGLISYHLNRGFRPDTPTPPWKELSEQERRGAASSAIGHPSAGSTREVLQTLHELLPDNEPKGAARYPSQDALFIDVAERMGQSHERARSLMNTLRDHLQRHEEAWPTGGRQWGREVEDDWRAFLSRWRKDIKDTLP